MGIDAGEFAFCFVGRALIADAEWPVKVQEGRFHELDLPYNRGTLVRFAEGAHEVALDTYAKVVRPVDDKGKSIGSPADIEKLLQAGRQVFLPSSVPGWA